MTTTDHPPTSPAAAPLRVFAEDWDPSYGAPATFDWDDAGTARETWSQASGVLEGVPATAATGSKSG